MRLDIWFSRHYQIQAGQIWKITLYFWAAPAAHRVCAAAPRKVSSRKPNHYNQVNQVDLVQLPLTNCKKITGNMYLVFEWRSCLINGWTCSVSIKQLFGNNQNKYRYAWLQYRSIVRLKQTNISPFEQLSIFFPPWIYQFRILWTTYWKPIKQNVIRSIS